MPRQPFYQMSKLPEPVTGYPLEPAGQSFFKIVIPESTINLCTNPSFERATTNYTASGGTLARTLDWQAHGSAGGKITPTGGSEANLAYGTATPLALTSGKTYTASVTLQGDPGKKYYIWFATTAGALLGSRREWVGTGYKQRIHVTYPETSTADRRVYITRASYADTRPFYVDGLQIEEKPYPTTYCDGDMKGFLLRERVKPYGWYGTPHASTSYRSSLTRSGGREMSLLSFGFQLLAILGLGLGGFTNRALQVPGYGELPQGIGLTAREFTLVGFLSPDAVGTNQQLQTLHAGLVDALKPDSYGQSLLLRYQSTDCDGIPTSESLDIICRPIPEIVGVQNGSGSENVALSFRLALPFIQKTYSEGVELGYQTETDDFANIGYRDSDGIWKAMGGGTSGATRALLYGDDGSVYAGGSFTDADGVASTLGFAKWTMSGWTAVGGGLGPSGNAVFALARGADGIYLGGMFTDTGGVSGDYIVKWDYTNYVALGGGTGGTVRAIAPAPNGYVYIGGDFTNLTDANGDYITAWTGANYVSLGSGMNGIVRAAVIGPDGNLYVGGDFTLAGGVAGTVHVAMWDGTQWVPLDGGVNGTVYAMAFGPNGHLYVGGNFTSAGGKLAGGVAEWDGYHWTIIGITNGIVYALAVDTNGVLYVGGDFSIAGGIVLPDALATYVNGVWMPADIDILDAAAEIYTVMPLDDNRLFIGGSWTSILATSATVTTPEITGGPVYPTIEITGPGTIWQVKNYSTGKALYFDNLTLLAGEIATLQFSPGGVDFSSTFRGNLLSYVLPGSDLSFELVPGENNVSALLYGSTSAASKIVMWWQPNVWSIDGAVVR